MDTKGLSRRSFLTLTATGLAGVALAACGAAPTPTSAPAAAPTKAPAAAPTTVPTAVAKKVPLNFLSAYTGSGQLDWMQKDLIPAFLKETPTVEKIDVVSTDWGKINEVLLAGFAAGQAPDLFEHGSAASGASWAASGQTIPLDDFFSTVANKSDYYDVALKTAYYKGKLYSMPLYVQPWGLGYRKDFFKEAGLDPENPPATWADLRTAAIALTKKDSGQVKRAGLWVPTQSWDGPQSGWMMFLHQNGATFLNDDMTKCAFDSDAGIEAMQFYHDLLWKDRVDILGGVPGLPTGHVTVTGGAAMGYCENGVLPTLKNNFPTVIPNYAIYGGPKQAKNALMLGVSRSFISVPSKNPNQAWQFLMYMHKLDNMVTRFKLAGNIPPFKSFMQTDAAKSDPMLSQLLKGVETGVQWPPSPKWNDYRSLVTAMSEGMMSKDGSVADTVKSAAKDINAILAK